jgi:metal-responsive CopG/Arc/MetJ family transcriptional regulator
MIGMTRRAKLKLSVTLSADVLALVDEDAQRLGATRSGIIELWLRRAAAENVERELEQATVAYYRSLRGEERREGEALSKALSKGARRVSYDESIEPRRRRVAR